jgi:hypothetical protein
MKILKVEPIRFHYAVSWSSGIANVTYVHRYGFLWLRKKVRKREASRATQIWRWSDDPGSHLRDLNIIVLAHVEEMVKGETIYIEENADQPLNEPKIKPTELY